MLRQQHRCVHELLERLCPDHAGLVEERLNRGVGTRERSRVRARRLRACGRTPALERENRLRARDPSRDARELPRVAERLEVERDQVRALVLLEALEQVVRRDVRLVPDRDERRETDAARVGRLDQREAERTALRREPDRAPARRLARERRVQAGAGGGDPEAVRADHPRSVRPHEREQPVLALDALRADLGEPRGDDAERANALRERVLGRTEHVLARDADHGEVDWIGDLGDRRVAPARPRRTRPGG